MSHYIVYKLGGYSSSYREPLTPYEYEALLKEIDGLVRQGAKVTHLNDEVMAVKFEGQTQWVVRGKSEGGVDRALVKANVIRGYGDPRPVSETPSASSSTPSPKSGAGASGKRVGSGT